MPTRSYSTRVNERDLATLITYLEANGKKPRTISRAIAIAVRMVVQRAVADSFPYASKAEVDTVLEFYRGGDDGPSPYMLNDLVTTDEGEERARKLMEGG